ncbi:MAG: DUF819 family protein [Bacteroidales bacterium]|nr:DUF819 family protein [Bacteroidales bacterium]
MGISIAMLIGYFLFPILIILLFTKVKWTRKIGTVMMAYAVGIIIALTGILPTGAEPGAEQLASWQKLLMNVAVPLAIPLMLFNSDFKLWTKSLPKTMAVLLGGIFSVVVALVAGYFVFRNQDVPQFEKVAAMMTGIYTGGTMNFNSLGLALNVDPSLIVLTLTFEEIVTFPFILFIVAGGYKLFRKFLPFPDTTVEETDALEIKTDEESFESYSGMLKPKTFGKMMLGFLLSVLFLAIGAGLSLLITHKLNELVVILTITTLSIIASFSKKIRELPKTFELGMFFILIFSVVVASQFNIYAINKSTLTIMWYILFVMVISIVLHLIICRIFKVNGDLFTVGHISLLCSPPFVPPIVEALGNKKVLLSGIVIGLAGYAIGNYLGVAIAALLGAL